MRAIKFFSSLSILILLGTACSRNSDDVVSNTANQPTGQWYVYQFWDQKDETTHFSGWAIQFNTNGSLLATKGGVSVDGTWLKTSDKLIIDFGSDALFSELNDDWKIQVMSASQIILIDDNPAQDDRLELRK